MKSPESATDPISRCQKDVLVSEGRVSGSVWAVRVRSIVATSSETGKEAAAAFTVSNFKDSAASEPLPQVFQHL